ncbi:MAG: cytidylate kinase family protein [Bacteroidales bacterium]|jgi:cytidylate kinase|nr:cytidylate kinase family protein [Bacteroidales bacterium]
MAKIITLTGDLGSGKSTVSSILIEKLGYRYIYTGDILRRIAERYGMSVWELNNYAETHPEIDEEVDNTFKGLADAENLIVDSRLAWHFLPNSFKVFLQVEPNVAAQRVFEDNGRSNEKYSSKEETLQQLNNRKKSELKRYGELYGVDCADMKNYDLIVDTSDISPKDVAQKILDGYRIASR